MCIGGSLATAGGLVFVGEANGNFNAFDAETGDVLWQFQTGAGVNAPPITYEIDGTQYVAVASGGNFQLNFPRGDTLWVFSLDGTLGPVAAPPAPSSEVAADAYATTTSTSSTSPSIRARSSCRRERPSPGRTTARNRTRRRRPSRRRTRSQFDSGILNPGQSYSFTFDHAGTYDYFCVPHPFMRGKVIVDPNAPAPAPKAEEQAAPQEIPEYEATPGSATPTPTT